MRESCLNLTHILLKVEKSVKEHVTSTYQQMATKMERKSTDPLFYCKNKSEISCLTVTSSWGYQLGFRAETSEFPSNTTVFYVCIANNLVDL